MTENIYYLFNTSLDYINHYQWLITLITSGCLVGLIYLGMHPLNAREDATQREFIAAIFRRIMLIILLLAVPVLLAYVYLVSVEVTGNSEYFNNFFKETIYGFRGSWALYAAIFIGTLTLKFFNQRILEPYISHLIRRFRVKQSADKMSDIRSELASLEAKEFDPKKHFKDGYMFLGFNEADQPIYETDEDFKERHLKIIGPTQTGKGVIQGVILYQSILKGWTTGFFDIKPDDFIYSIMVKACKEAGRPAPLVVDLNGVGPGSYNMFANGSEREIISRMQNVFNVNETGTNADFYNVKERAVILDIFKNGFDGSMNALEAGLNKEYETTEKSRASLKEMKLHKPLNPKKGRGFNVDRTLDASAVFYIKGSITDKLVKKAQITLLMDIIQSVLRRGKQSQHFYLAIDEVKFLVCDMLSVGLSTVLSKGMNISVAYQSMSNLLNMEDKTLNAEAICSEIEINTLISIVYKAADTATAEWAAELSGTVNKTIIRSEEVDYNNMGAEAYTGRKQTHQDQEELISINKMRALPKRVSALFRPEKLAEILYTSWIPLLPNEMVDITDLKKTALVKPPQKEVDNKDQVSNDTTLSEPAVKNTVKDIEPGQETINAEEPANEDYSLDQFMIEAGLKPNKE